MRDVLKRTEGLREQKRRQTHQRIAEVGLSSFLAKGYEATTLEEIAAAAGISRRTLFYYFKSKDDILLAHLSGYADILKSAILENASVAAPLDLVRATLVNLSTTRFQSYQTIAFARLIRESEVLRARQLARYAQLEQALHEALCNLWPDEQRRDGLRLVAMVSIGTLRLAADKWFEQNGERPLAKYIEDAFEHLKVEI